MNRTKKHTSLKRQRGVSLPIALILLVPLTLLGVTLANRNNLEEMMASSQRDGQQSLMNAESGLAIGQYVLTEMVVNQVAAEEEAEKLGETLDLTTVVTIDQVLGQTKELTYLGASLGSLQLAEGTVTVEILDNNDEEMLSPPQTNNPAVDIDDMVVLRSTGNFVSGERVVEAIVSLKYIADPLSSNLPPLTIFTEEYIRINGNPSLYGPDSLVHTNAYVDITGTTYASGQIQQVAEGEGDNYQQAVDGVWGNWTTAQVETGVARIQTPYVYPPVYKGMATRYLTANCEVWDGAPGYTNPLTGAASQLIGVAGKEERDNVEGWTCEAASGYNKYWLLKLAKAVTSNFFYVEGNVLVPGDIGEPGNPAATSIVAEGFINITGNPFMEPYYVTQGDYTNDASRDALADIIIAGTPDYNGVSALDAVLLSDEVLLLAGGDVYVKGNYSTDPNYFGMIAAHDHVQVAGNPVMSGSLLAENSKYTSADYFFDNIYSNDRKSNLVEINLIDGNPEIYASTDFSGGGAGGSGDPVGANLKGWREPIID